MQVIFQNVFSPKAPSTEAPSFRGDPRSNLEVLCHEATFQECQKSWKLEISHSVRPDPAAQGPRKLRVVFLVISVLSKPPRLPYGAKYFFYWAPVSEPGFLDFQIFGFLILEIFAFCNIYLENMLVRYRGINNKGVLERPWTKWRVLRAISGTLKCQFTVKCWKVDFLTPCTTTSAELCK